jgi:hypothetical protein
MAPKAKEEKKGLVGAAGGAVGGAFGAVTEAAKKAEGVAEGAAKKMGAATMQASGSGAKLAEGQGAKALGAYDRLWMKHINQVFGDDLELAFRASFFVWVCGVPFMLPTWVCPICQEAIATKFVSSGSVVYFMFTLYKTTGDTINFGIGGFLGTCIAVFNIWCMMGFMPGGYHGPDSPDQWIWYAGMAWGGTYVFLMLWLNFEGNTQVFGLATYVWYWMAFINYHVATGFSHSFTINYKGAAVRELCIAMSGIGIAIIAGFVPYPMFAMKRAQKTGKTLCFQLHSTWTDFTDYYAGEEKNPYRSALINKKLSVMKSLVPTLQGYVASAWYECFGMGSWQRQRMMLKQLDSFMGESFNRLCTVLNCCVDEDFNDTHDKLMAEVREPMMKIVDEVGGLLVACVETIEVGDCNASKENLTAACTELKKAVLVLTKEFLAAQKKLGLNVLSDDCSGENVVCSNICAFSRLSCEFAERLMEPVPTESASWKDGGGVAGIFQPSHLTDKMQLNFVLRNWLSICISFWVGYRGVAGKMILPYNAALASTCCVLLSRAVGSAMAKNLNRLQGVVLGTVIGQTAYALLAWCTTWGYMSVAVSVLLWATVTLFIYYNSAQFGTVGLLLAVFGVTSLLQGCSDEVYNPATSYYGVINTTGGICIMCVVDTLFAPGRASEMAVAAYFAAWDPLVKQSKDLFDFDKKRLPPRKGALRGLIAGADAMGKEAYEEPRYWRAAWPTATFDRAVTCLSTLRFTLAALEGGVTNMKANGEAAKEDHFLEVLKMDSFETIKKCLMSRFDETKVNLDKALNNETGASLMNFSQSQMLSSDLAEKHSVAMKTIDDFVVEFNKQKHRDLPEDGTLEDDAIADMSILTEALRAIFSELEAVNEIMVS